MGIKGAFCSASTQYGCMLNCKSTTSRQITIHQHEYASNDTSLFPHLCIGVCERYRRILSPIMATMDCTNLFRVYRALTAWLVLLTSILHISLGSWYTSRGWNILDSAANQTVDFTTRAEIVVIGTGVGLMLCGITLLCGVWFREGKVAFGLRLSGCAVAFILLMFETITAWTIHVNRAKAWETNAYQAGWISTLNSKPKLICQLEQRLHCRAFLDTSCRSETCAKCNTVSTPFRQPCFTIMKQHLATSYVPVSITSTILSLIVLIDLILAYLVR